MFNFDVPIHAEDYVHRIGRTGRAGLEGRSFTLATSEDGKFVAQIESLIGKAIPAVAMEGIEAPEFGAESEHRFAARPLPSRQRPFQQTLRSPRNFARARYGEARGEIAAPPTRGRASSRAPARPHAVASSREHGAFPARHRR